jgi:catechol 2,3-dioxygenase-like lactoylglutathione lyase family enzyme
VGQEHADKVIEFGGVCIDCGPDQFANMVAFYVATLGAEVVHHEQDWASLCDPRGTFINIQAQDWYVPPAWPEHPAGQTKMIHFECGVSDMEAAVALVVQAGGMVAPYQPYDRDPSRLLVVLDPAGHPFCLLAS